MAGNTDRVTYNRMLLLDLYPGPDYPHVTVVSFEKTGIPVTLLRNLKLTRELRLQPRNLPIYADPGHEHYLVAKVESDVNRTEELRAAQAVNEFIRDRLKKGVSIQEMQRHIVDNFRSRVQKLVPFVSKENQGDQKRNTSRFRQRVPVSSSDFDLSANEAGAAAARALDFSHIQKPTKPGNKCSKGIVKVGPLIRCR